MPPIRFKVRTMMIVIAAAAVLMGLLRWSPPIFAFLATIVVEITPFVVYYRFLRTRRRQFSEDQSPVPDTGAGPKWGGRESAG
jgi:Flp pilus assembly protein TadB